MIEAWSWLHRYFGCATFDVCASHRFDHVAGVVAAAHEGSASDLRETEPASLKSQFSEFLRRQIAHHRQMLGRRLQVLAEGQEVAAHTAQIGQRVEQFFVCLAQAEHQAALGFDRGIELLHAAEDFQRPTIDALAAARSIVATRVEKPLIEAMPLATLEPLDGLLQLDP